MTEQDWSAFKRLDRQIFAEDRVEKKEFKRYLTTDGFFALELDPDILIGYLYVGRYGDKIGHLGRIGVAEGFQKQGFGSQLMEHALNWCRQQPEIKTVRLYTQDFNESARHLYQKFGFQVKGTTWHYFVPFETIHGQGKYECHKASKDEIDFLSKKYSQTMPASVIQRWLERAILVVVLKTLSGEIVGASRFSPEFPGAFPFELDTIEAFDDFIDGLSQLSLPEFNYVRVTFNDNPDLAKELARRKYKLHHRLHRMELDLAKQ